MQSDASLVPWLCHFVPHVLPTLASCDCHSAKELSQLPPLSAVHMAEVGISASELTPPHFLSIPAYRGVTSLPYFHGFAFFSDKTVPLFLLY